MSFTVTPLDARAYALLAEAGFGDDVFNPRQHESCELVERYVVDRAIALLGTLGLSELLATPRTVAELAAARGFVAAFAPALGWLLGRLEREGLLTCDAAARYRLPGPLPVPAGDTLRARVLAADPSYAPTLALLDEAIEVSTLVDDRWSVPQIALAKAGIAAQRGDWHTTSALRPLASWCCGIGRAAP